MLNLCLSEGVGVLPWSPLARGRLARPWENEPGTIRAQSDEFAKTLYVATEDADKKLVDRVTEISKIRNISHAQISLAWLLSKPSITAPIAGATKLNHLEDAVAAVSIKLTSEEIKMLEAPYIPHSLGGY